MDTLAAPVKSFNLQEPIPGYRLRERIGAGGYGEVWLADAPGGLTKAVKIVYGPLSAQRADRELKSLNRIRQVQHPLLLSLERFEIVDDHLIIVTELAQGSLRDRFDEHVEAGHRGIPRAELLAYLRDVADGLDYLFDQHSLQHLDVKPENLLLIADRVKVADFGLVKDLQEQSESLVGGLTPLYAPPEIFDGRPNQHSDQYSLAIVYQEMLTGEPPFAGRTVAQLAAQHLHSAPCLSALPKLDQPIVARGLSKDPSRRFTNCRALIDALTDAHRQVQRTRRTTNKSLETRRPSAGMPTKTVLLGEGPQIQFPITPEVRLMPPLEAETAIAPLGPSVFLGVGGFAGKVLQQLRRRLHERFGNADELPAFQMLLFDTDTSLLNEASRGERTTALRSNQLVPIPLRQPADYRNDSAAILEWLSRRWLYNIPRSLLTEGIRPLGRLAFVDHFTKIVDAIQHAIVSATSDEAIQASSQAAGIAFESQTPRVFVIGTSSGGTSGGCALDLGYTVQSILDALSESDKHLIGVFAHGTPRKASARDLAVANTLSFLNEWRRYCSPDGYPGEPACGLPANVGKPPFQSTYFVSLGEQVDAELVPSEAGLAEYIYQAAVGRASTVLDKARDANELEDALSVRTFGVHRIGGTEGEFIRAESDLICRRLISHWAGQTRPHGQDKDAIDPSIEETAKKFANGLDLRLDRLVAWADDIVSRELVDDPRAFFRRTIAEIRAQLPPNIEANSTTSGENPLCEQIDAFFFSQDDHVDSLQSRVEARVKAVASMKAEALRDWFSILVDARKTRVQGAQDAVRWFGSFLDDLETRARAAIADAARDPDLELASHDDESLLQYALARLRQVTRQAVCRLLCVLQAETIRSSDQLYEFAARLRQLGDEFCKSEIPEETLVPALADISRKLKQEQRILTERLDRQLAPALVNKEITLSALLHAGSDVWMRLVSAMRTTAATLVGSVITRSQVSAVVGTLDSTCDSSLTRRTINKAFPDMLDCGGEARLFLIAPEEATRWPDDWRGAFAKAAGVEPQVVLDADESLTICYEASQVPMQNAVVKLAAGRDDFYKLASRLHTRIDVEWTSLAEWLTEPEA